MYLVALGPRTTERAYDSKVYRCDVAQIRGRFGELEDMEEEAGGLGMVVRR